MLRENVSKQTWRTKKQKQELTDTDDGFGTYIKYGISLLSNLQRYYDGAEVQAKQKFLGLIFPEKLVIEDGEYRTNEPSDLLSLFCSTDKGFSGLQKKKGGISAHPSCGSLDRNRTCI